MTSFRPELSSENDQQNVLETLALDKTFHSQTREEWQQISKDLPNIVESKQFINGSVSVCQLWSYVLTQREGKLLTLKAVYLAILSKTEIFEGCYV